MAGASSSRAGADAESREPRAGSAEVRSRRRLVVLDDEDPAVVPFPGAADQVGEEHAKMESAAPAHRAADEEVRASR